MDAPELGPGEIEMLIDGLSDDVAFDWVLIHLGLRGNPPSRDSAPTVAEVDSMFATLERMVAAGLVKVGRIEYIDGGPPGRVAPVHHVEEALDVVRDKLNDCVKHDDWSDWAFAFWVVNTELGSRIAREALARRETS